MQDAMLFEALFHAYPDALIVCGDDGVIVRANDAAAALLDYPRDTLVGMTVDTLVPDAVRSSHARHRAAYAGAPRARPMGAKDELSARRRDGSEVVVEIALSPLSGLDRAYTVAAIRSVAEYPRVKEAVKRARHSEYLAELGRLVADTRDPTSLLERVPALAAQALDVAASRVLLLEPDGLALRVAAGTGEVPGKVIGSTIGLAEDPIAEAVLGTGRPLSVADLRNESRIRMPPAYLATGLQSVLSVPLFDRGRIIGTLSVAATRPNFFGLHEQHFLSSLSALLATALQRAASEDALNHAQRLETVGQLTGGIAHDFNNLLTIVHGNLQLLEDEQAIAADPVLGDFVAAAMRAATRGAELTRKLLVFSRRQVLHPTAVDLAPMLASVTDMLRRTVDQRIEIVLGAPAAGLHAFVDAPQMESTILNIAINARDAMPSGGMLSLRARLVDGTASDEALETSAPAMPAAATRRIVIEITDTGTGMSAEVKRRAFEPFFTTKPVGRGTGLGLSTVYGFVAQSRGTIRLDSELGVGTTVTIELPWHAEAVAEAAGPAQSASSTPPDAGEGPPAPRRVLLVEDDRDVRSVTRAYLETLGCEVVIAPSGEQALSILADETPFDLLLTDVALGAGMRGTQLAREVQRRHPGTAILLMSGYSADLLGPDAAEADRLGLLAKPFDRAQLGAALARAITATSRPGRPPG